MSTDVSHDIDQAAVNALNHIAAHADRPANVVQAIARVTAEIGGIAKLTQSQRRALGQQVSDQGVTYAFRGIDQISAAAQPLFGLYGVTIVPWVLDQQVKEIEVNNKPWTDTTVTVQWSIYGPGGIEDCIGACTVGQGRDNSDKGINKAMTTAYKNLLLRLLCIGDPKDDTDQHEPAERSAAPRAAPMVEPTEPQMVSQANIDAVRKNATELGASLEDITAWVRVATDGRTELLPELLTTEIPALRAARDAWRAEKPEPTLPLDAS